MKKRTLCVIFGGRSSEYTVSLRSAYKLISCISKEKYDLVRIGITKSGEWYLFEGRDEDILNDTWHKDKDQRVLIDASKGELLVVGKYVYALHIDFVFPVMHGEYVEDGRIQGLFDVAGIPYLGCGAFCSHICMDKSLAKAGAQSLGVSVAHSLLIKMGKNGEYLLNGEKIDLLGIKALLNKMKIGYPVFVKPTMCGSSVGVSRVQDGMELKSALELALGYGDSALIEECIHGYEVELGVLEINGEPTASCVGMIRHSSEFYDYNTKYESGGADCIIPAPIDEKTAAYIRDIGKRLFLHFGCVGFARFDFFVSRCGKVIFNEVNTMPGFTSGSMFAMLFNATGVDMDLIIDSLVNSAKGKRR